MGAREEIAAPAAYADASALVKLIFPESESHALDVALNAEDRVLASEIVAVELSCAVQRRGLSATVVEPVLHRVALAPVDATILARARRPFSRPLRALDAIHLATAISLREDLGPFYAYDAELAEAAVEAGLHVAAPG